VGEGPTAALLQQIVEVDPLACPSCHGVMRLVAFITQQSVIDQILAPLRTRAATADPRRRRAESSLDPRTVWTARPPAFAGSAIAPYVRRILDRARLNFLFRFNNVLTAISNFSELLLEELSNGGDAHDEVLPIRAEAAARAMALTRQLLAFSRKQILRPRAVNVGTLVRDMERLIARVTTEEVTIRLTIADSLPPVVADPVQLEQVLLKLAVNGSEAMPDGGVLSIAVSDVALGESYAHRHHRVSRVTMSARWSPTAESVWIAPPVSAFLSRSLLPRPAVPGASGLWEIVGVAPRGDSKVKNASIPAIRAASVRNDCERDMRQLHGSEGSAPDRG